MGDIMRPASIVQFERLFLAALAIDIIGTLWGLGAAVATLKANPATAQYGASAVLATLLLFFAAGVALWYLAAHRRSIVAKWIIAAWFVLATSMLALSLFQGVYFGLATLLGWLAYGLRAWSVSYLFKPDADAWFSRK